MKFFVFLPEKAKLLCRTQEVWGTSSMPLKKLLFCFCFRIQVLIRYLQQLRVKFMSFVGSSPRRMRRPSRRGENAFDQEDSESDEEIEQEEQIGSTRGISSTYYVHAYFI